MTIMIPIYVTLLARTTAGWQHPVAPCDEHTNTIENVNKFINNKEVRLLLIYQ